MLKVIWIARFRRGLAKDVAREHWRGTHGALGAEVPGLHRYVQSQVAGPLPPETDAPPFDGYSSGWYADDEAYVRSMASPEWAAIGADSDNVFDTPFFWGMSAFVDERVLVAPGAGAVKIAAVVRFERGAGDRWARCAEEALGGVPGLAGCALNIAGDAIGIQGRSPDLPLGFGGVAEIWFDDHTALVNALASRGWRATAAAVDADGGWWALVEERVIRDVASAGTAGPAAARG
jgi:uncharacterized protein (TIGR02118 family)